LFVGNASDGYLSGLGIRPDDVVYSEREKWIASMGIDRGRGRTSYLANAGEIVKMRGPLHLGRDQIPTLLKLQRRGGKLMQSGAGIRDVTGAGKLARLSVLRRFDLLTWRDPESRAYVSRGRVAPDWGFLSHDPVLTGEIEGVPQRRTLAVTLRGDRPEPSADWYDAVRALADRLDLEITPFAQVRRDDERAHALADRLGASRVVSWESDDHAVQEHSVRELFRASAAVISDRLHALIIGATEGAYPLGLPAGNPEKLVRTLAPADFETFLSGSNDAQRWLATADTERLRGDLKQKMSVAQQSLRGIASEILELLDVR
jgi:hypothetical protein